MSRVSDPGAQPPPHPTPYAPGPYAPQAPLPPGPPPGPPSRTPGWVWPVVAVTALVVGLLGGVLGGALVLGTSSGSGSAGLGPLESGERGPAADGSIAAVAQRLLPSTVQVRVRGAGKGKDVTAGTGSGFVIDRKGHVVTNNHVTEVAEDGGTIVVVDNAGRPHKATLVGSSEVYDLAVVEIEQPGDLRPVVFGSSRRMYVGDTVVAIGSPLGLDHTVTAGIVSALDRPVTTGDQSSASYINAVQTDAAINPGNSGGPLVNLAGQVVGINSSIRSSSDLGGEGGSIGLGFAIPISKVLPVVDQLRNGQTPTHARLGITVSDKGSSTDPTEDGLITGAGVEEVTNGSAGDEAGLQAGDVVTKVDDEPISSSESLVATIRGYRPGDKVTLTVLRDGKTLTLDATLDSDVESATS